MMEREFHLRKKKSHRGTILLLGIALLIFVTAIKYIPNNENESEIIPEPHEAAALNSQDDKKIRLNENSAVKLSIVYSCGHIKTKTSETDESLIGKTRSEIEKTHPDWQIKDFNESLITAEISEDFPCDDHYIIKLKGDTLYVYKTNDQSASVRTQKISTAVLTPSDISELTAGISASTEFEVLSILESFA